jgi:hypothetical protein
MVEYEHGGKPNLMAGKPILQVPVEGHHQLCHSV